MVNFKEETLEELKERGKTWKDVKFIQGNSFTVLNSKEDFLKLMDFEYDSGYGSPEIATDLIIVGEDWWLERHEYDGSEWWEYKELPKLNTCFKPIKYLCSTQVDKIGWKTLEELNKEPEVPINEVYE